MRKSFTYFAAGVLVTGLLAFTTHQYEVRKNTAEAEQAQGLYIFHQSKPVGEHDVLGTVKLGGVASYSYDACRDRLLKSTKKEYPSADGLILDENAYRAEVIKFK